MKQLLIFLLEFVLTTAIVFAGESTKKILFIHGERSAVITLGIMGMLFCLISVGKFIAQPTHPLTILGCLIGAVAMVAFLTQVFQWNLSFFSTPKVSLFIIAACILIDGAIARFAYLLVKQG